MQLPITIGLRRSRILSFGLIILAACAITVSLVSPLTTEFKLANTVFIAIFFMVSWRQLTPDYQAIRLEQDGSISIQSLGQDSFVLVEVAQNLTVHPWLTLFRVTTPVGRVHTLIATVDTLENQNFRRLRVFLRWRLPSAPTK